jgi:uncharacterized protein
MPYLALIYNVVDDFASRRTPYRSEHLRLASEAHDRGELLLGGALADPVDTALIIFRCDSASSAEDFARNDPYVKNGLVKEWKVRPWNVVVGQEAAVNASPAGRLQ